jgi:glutathione synthase|tara:strand:+ start:2893 stop:3900 length:1008 start_codon:yes stop_codon:yes gene_type:complete
MIRTAQSLSVAFQMDPLESIDITGDSSFAMGLEAQARGHRLFYYHPNDLAFREGKVMARSRPMELRREAGNFFTLGAALDLNLAEIDVIMMRQDPPFDMAYITATHLLDLVHPNTLVVNNPAEVRNAPEKLFVMQFPDLMPPTLVTRSRREIEAFRARHKDIILKPLYGNGGAGVFHVKPDDENFKALLETFEERNREPFVIQRYLPEIRQGDKRIILVDGAAVGATNRVPQTGEARSNMHVGGQAQKVELTPRDLEICATIGPVLKEKGLIFVGIDVIGDYLTEINVTSPTGIQEIDRFNGSNISGDIWDAIERRRASQPIPGQPGHPAGKPQD